MPPQTTRGGKNMSGFLQLLEQQGNSSVVSPLFVSLVPLFIVLFLFKWFSTSPTSPKRLPPSPSKLPIIGNLHQLGSCPYRSLQTLSRRHGSLMLLHFGSVPVLVVSSADAACEIMKTHDRVFSNRPKLSISNRLLYDGKDVSAAPYGEYWRQMRSICVLQLLNRKRVESFRAVRNEETALLVEKIKQSSKSSSSVDLSQRLMSLTNDVVCRAALGRKYSELGENGRKFKVLLGQFVELSGFNVGEYIPWLAWVNKVNGIDAKVEKVFKDFDRFLDAVVEDHMDRNNREANDDGSVKGENQEDFVDVLLGIQKDNMAGFTIDKDNIKALVLDMFVAGTDTSYAVLEWAMTELLRHPRVMKEVQNEVRGITGSKPDITEDDLEKMHYLKAVLKETLRLHPPLPLLVPRESTQEIEVKGYDIAAGTMVITNAWAIGRDPATWDEPEVFWPERFLNSSIDFKGQNFQWIPFGAGRRGCPGISFAMATNELVLANLVQKFDWALPGGARGEDLDMTESIGVTIHRKNPLLTVAIPHSY